MGLEFPTALSLPTKNNQPGRVLDLSTALSLRRDPNRPLLSTLSSLQHFVVYFLQNSLQCTSKLSDWSGLFDRVGIQLEVLHFLVRISWHTIRRICLLICAVPCVYVSSTVVHVTFMHTCTRQDKLNTLALVLTHQRS